MRTKPRENNKGQQGHRKREGVRNGGEDRDNDTKREGQGQGRKIERVSDSSNKKVH